MRHDVLHRDRALLVCVDVGDGLLYQMCGRSNVVGRVPLDDLDPRRDDLSTLRSRRAPSEVPREGGRGSEAERFGVDVDRRKRGMDRFAQQHVVVDPEDGGLLRVSRGLSPQVLVLRVLSVAVSANIWYNTAIDKKEKP